jgi:ADP-ribose pyrophosphatase
MNSFAKLISKKTLYKGHSELYKYQMQVKSQDLSKHTARTMQREILHTYDAVVVLIYAADNDSFILCKEFRPGVFFNKAHDDPYIYECVAGMIDKNKTPEETAYQEIQEEAGLKAEHLQLITTVYSSPGHMTEKTYIYFTELKGTPKTGMFGLAEEGEEISTHLIKRDVAYQMMDEMKIKDAMTLLALYWFRAKYKP